MKPELLGIVPVLPSSDIARDAAWYKEKAGFETVFADNMYAVLYRDRIGLHLQWHADTQDDPLLGGSVIRIFVNDVRMFFDEFVRRGAASQDALRLNTPWHTHEFGFHDLNKNAIFFVEGL